MSAEVVSLPRELAGAGALSVRRAGEHDIKSVAALFDAYRRFYDRTSDAEQGAIRLELRTARSNLPAQSLYESTGWRRNEQFHSYSKWLVDLWSG